MTLILSANVGNWGAVQVSDRRFSSDQGQGRTSRVYDHANKQLLVRCTDALVCIGFAGVAQLPGGPTDEWIARKILNTTAPLDDAIGGPTMPATGFSEVFRDLQLSLSAIAGRPDVSKHGVTISVVGLRRVRATAEPFWAGLRTAGGQVVPYVSRKYKYFEKPTISVNCLGSGQVEADAFVKRTLPSRGVLDATVMEEFLVEVVRHVAANDDTVGSNVMIASVNTDPELPYNASVRFDPSPDLPATADTFTPWILGPGLTHPPTISMSGGATIQSPAFTVKVAPSPHHQTDGNTALRVARAPRPPKRLTSDNHQPSSEVVLERLRTEHFRMLGRQRKQTPEQT